MDDMDKTVQPVRRHADYESAAEVATIPGKRIRNRNGDFRAGDQLLDRYKVICELGHGGMGVVYKCFDEVAGVEVALKALPPELSHNSFEMEEVKINFRLVHNLFHANIAAYTTLEHDRTNGNYYLIMEFCDGEILRSWYRRKQAEGPIAHNAILVIIAQIANALDYAHKEKKIIHRDIKPGNIIVDRSGRVKILDFGLAAQIHSSMTRVSMVCHDTSGTGPYMAPEQWRGRPQGAYSDQYSLAVMTYELFAGHLPFESNDPVVLKQAILDEEPEDIDGVPTQIQNAIKRAMSKNPADRFESCSAFYHAMIGDAVVDDSVEILAIPEPVKEEKTSVEDVNASIEDENASVEDENASVEEKERAVMVEAVSSEKHKTTSFSAVLCVIGVLIIGFSALFIHAYRNRNDRNFSHKLSGKKQQLHFHHFKLPGGVDLKMVQIQPGSFYMSRDDGENEKDEIEHSRTLKKVFYIGMYEVTNEQWCAVMGVKKSPSAHQGAKLPVDSVSWRDAMVFCEKLNRLCNEQLGGKMRFTLPTETQWEYVASGGQKTNGFKYSGNEDLNYVGWYADNSKYRSQQVGRQANELGVYDMSGNVWEWCLDNWVKQSTSLQSEFTRRHVDNDYSYRSARGGSYNSVAKYCRIAYRVGWPPDKCGKDIGFRLALVPVK